MNGHGTSISCLLQIIGGRYTVKEGPGDGNSIHLANFFHAIETKRRIATLVLHTHALHQLVDGAGRTGSLEFEEKLDSGVLKVR